MSDDRIPLAPAPTLAGWAWLQFKVAARLIADLLLIGAVVAIVRGNFHFRAWLSGVFTMVGGTAVVAGIAFYPPGPLSAGRELFLWAGCLSVAATGGAWIAKITRRLGFWECYLAWVVTIAVVVTHLAWGWETLLGFGPEAEESYLDFLQSLPPGVRLLGPMWARLVGLGALGGFLTTLVGASLAYQFSDPSRGARFEWWIARRHLAGDRAWVSSTAAIAVLGISLGVAALIAVTAVMSGYQRDVQTKILSTNAHLVVQKYGIDFTEYEETIERARSVQGVMAASPFSFNEAMLSDGNVGVGVLLKGVIPQTAGSVTDIESNLCADELELSECRPGSGSQTLLDLLTPRDGLPALILGFELFKKLNRPYGSVVSLTTPVGIAGARGNAPRRMNFRVTGVFRSGMHEFDSRLIYLRLSDAQKLMGMGQAVNGVEFRVENPQDVELIGRQVLAAVGRYPYRTLDWRELNAGIFTALRLQKIVMFLVLCFIVIVAAFNIASTLFMGVVEKARDIAVLKSMGATDVSILRIFVFEGWMVGGVGTGIGLGLGLGVCSLLSRLHIGIAADVYMVNSLKVLVNPIEVGMTVAAALLISHLATIYPALKAAAQAPVDAMRYE